LYSGDEVPHPLFGRQNAAMRANSSAMIKSAFVMREMVGGKQGTILEVGVVLGFCVLDRALRELLVVLWFDQALLRIGERLPIKGCHCSRKI